MQEAWKTQLVRGEIQAAAMVCKNIIQLIQKQGTNLTEEIRLEHAAAAIRLLQIARERIECRELDLLEDINDLLVYKLISDYALRKAAWDLAAKLDETLSKYSGVSQSYLFSPAKKVTEELRQQNLSSALHWCSVHRSKLQSIGSFLEVELYIARALQFIESNQLSEAISIAQKNLAEFFVESDNISYRRKIKELLGTLGISTQPQENMESRLGRLEEMFMNDFLMVNGLRKQCLLEALVCVGYSCISAFPCDQNWNPNCVRCFLRRTYPDMQDISCIPMRSSRSWLICRISKEVMDQDNLPLALPNGQVYSTKALTKMALMNNGTVTCLQTGRKYHLQECRKVFVL